MQAEDPDTGSPEPLRSGITDPAKLMRAIDVTRQVLDELHHGGLDQAARTRVHTSHHAVLHQLRDVLPEDDRQELNGLLAPLEPGDAPPSGAELRLAEAQLLGWLEGTLKGMEASEVVRQTDAQANQVSQARQAEPARSSFGEPQRYR